MSCRGTDYGMHDSEKVSLRSMGYPGWSCVAAVVLLQAILITDAYNLDANDVIVLSEPRASSGARQSFFGYSAALYVAGNGVASVIVGAPRANSSELRTAVEPGVVYKCSVDGACKEWVIDRSDNGPIKDYPGVRQIKDHAWIGAAIAVENKTAARIAVCGPRWTNNVVSWGRPNWYVNGICYTTVADGEGSFEKEAERMLPLVNGQQVVSYRNVGVYHFGMGQVGFSLHMPNDDTSDAFVYGAPGLYYWNGMPLLARRTRDDDLETLMPVNRNDQRAQSGDYFGYAVTSGCYFEKGTRWYASAAPRGGGLLGNVYIFSFPATTNLPIAVKKVLNGEQYGEYFGSALASCDLNDDGRDDLIVGAPLWTRHEDEGRVYIFVGRQHDNFDRRYVNGERSGGRFGSAVTCLGDVDRDGYGDIAVGAPYEGETGAVYVYNGNRNGLSGGHSQRIVGRAGIRGFGISISEPRDVSGDRWPDVAVGAHRSGHVVLLRSMPVVTLTTKFVRSDRRKLLANSTMFAVDACTIYDGVYAPESVSVVATLKVDEEHGRAYVTTKEPGNTYQLREILRIATISCKQLEIHIRDNIRNVIDPIVMALSLEIDQSANEQCRRNLSRSNCAVINRSLSKTSDIVTLPFSLDCGSDDICHSDLSVTLWADFNSLGKYVIGSKEPLRLVVNVSNNGEAAYQARLRAYIPGSLSLADLPPECTENGRVHDDLEVVCDLDNPLTKPQTIHLEVDMSAIQFDTSQVVFSANVSTQSEETDLGNNAYNLPILFDVDVDIAIAGSVRRDPYSHSRRDNEEGLDSVRFQHLYEVQNFGVSPVETAMLVVSMPTHWRDRGREIEVARINETVLHMDGRRVYCGNYDQTSTESATATSTLVRTETTNRTDDAHILDAAERNQTTAGYAAKDVESVVASLPENRTLYVNCSNGAFRCGRVLCGMGPFSSNLSVARFLVTIDLQLSTLRHDVIKDQRDVIFFVSEGRVSITDPAGVTQSGQRPDKVAVGTTFVGMPIAGRVAAWIVILSVLAGIILLILLIVGLLKAGFFHRKKKEELEALKAETDSTCGPPATAMGGPHEG